MIVNKKFDRLRQWGKERMGGEVATNASDEFKALEIEMELRQNGMDRVANASNAYIKSLNKRDCGEGSNSKDKTTAIAHFGATLTSHGDDFAADSEFGQCLLGLGRANERIARLQETFTANASGSWLESVERSQVQMKELQTARKRLESRRLAFDTASAKVQRAKREDYKVEEEARSQRAKYEESYEEVVRRMLDVKEAEGDTVADLTSLLDTQLAYYDKCREILVQVRREWPADSVSPTTTGMGGYGGGAGGYGIARSETASPAPSLSRTLSRRNTNTGTGTTFSRSRTNSVISSTTADEFANPLRPTISGSRLPSGQNSPRRELPGFDLPSRPALGPSPAPPPPKLSRVPTDPNRILEARSSLRATGGKDRGRADSIYGDGGQGVFGDDASDSSQSPTNGDSGVGWQSGSMLAHDGSHVSGAVNGGKRAPPPPPPSRSKKPPPPPPMKRSALSTSDVLNY